ncbi:hypothetical protein D9M71_632660 [compost metagenome]
MPAEHRQDFLERCVEVQADQVFTRVGPVDHFQLAHFHGRCQYAHALVARVLAAAGVQDQLELFTAVMMVVMWAGLALASNTQDGVGTGVEQPDGRVHHPVEQVQGNGRP